MTDTFKEEWMTGPEGHQFYTRTYAAPAVPSAIILFVHGFAEHIGRYEHIHSKYPTRNITLFTFDQRGYGRTALDVAHRSKDSAYGKTNWTWQMGDIEHFATYLAKEHPGVPLFLMGHSMGGGLVLAYFTRPSAPPSEEGVKLFSGVISCSPFLTLTTPKPKLLRWTGAKLASLAPYTPFPADPGVEVSLERGMMSTCVV
ncbi:hypothetical protein PHLCEN_2v11404 [Hermanssonia centrifuga]|uniref:Serine aminopeptidase S33 domain-containing protein n=1 Tax=Hermanssonia centrifuga TaxID=98765 RepID=A0A2R6NK11_9APHY|nr:hypothetical protein PHLCEN_2v11404 [Hermanssonia centrifuga]